VRLQLQPPPDVDYVSNEVSNSEITYNRKKRKEKKAKPNLIPQSIYQTYSTSAKYLASGFQNCSQDVLRQLNPSWDYQLFFDDDIENYIKSTWGNTMWTLYQSIHPSFGASRADLFRYLLLYDRGGVYFDAKSHCTRPLDKVLRADDEYILGHWRIPYKKEEVHLKLGEYVNWFIAARPRHPFLKKVISTVLHNLVALHKKPKMSYSLGSFDFRTGEWDVKEMVLNTTGPIAYSLAIESVQAAHRNIGVVEDSGITYTCRPHVSMYQFSASPLVVPSSAIANADVSLLTESLFSGVGDASP